MVERYSRNTALFGTEGQRQIAATSVAVVGLGGLGSHVVQQLAYLGVANYVLIDFDTVTESSLNRLVGATDADVAEATRKVAVAERSLRSVKPDATVSIAARSGDPEAAALIRQVDIVFGCLDRDLPRLQLTDLCSRYARPLFDLATDVGGEGSGIWYGGRVLLCDGSRCAVCLGLLDQAEMAVDAMSPSQREEHQRIYGVPRSELGDTGPMVISINGAVASMAVTEFIALATGLRAPFGHLKYLANQQVIRQSVDPPEPNCYYCNGLWGSGKA